MIPLSEQETTITYDSGEKVVRIYSSRPPDINKLRRAGIDPIDGTKASGFRYRIPMAKLAWRIRKPKAIGSKNHLNLGGKTGRKGTLGVGKVPPNGFPDEGACSQ